MKKYFIYLLLVLYTGFTFGQNVQLGKEADNASFSHIPIIIHKDNDKMYVLRISKINPQGYKILMNNEKASLSAFLLGYGRANSDESIMNLDNYYGKGTEYALEVYDGQMNLQKSYPFDVVLEKAGMLSSTGNKAIFPKKVAFLNNKITFFSTLYDAKQKKITAGYHFLSNEGVLEKQLTPFTEISVSDDDLEKQMAFYLSPDRTKVLFYYPIKADSKNPQTKVYLKMIDASNFSTLWENQFVVADKDANADIESVTLNNKGNVFILSKNDLKGQEKDKSAQKYKYVLYSCNKDSKALEELNLKIGDQYYVNNVLLKIDKNDNVLASGFYSEKSANYAKGAYVINMDASTGELKMNTLAPFSNAVSGEDKEDADKEKAFYHMRDIHFLNDGNIVLLGEQYFIDISRSRGYGAYGAIGGSTSFTYRYKNILVMCLTPTGELKWMKDIPKKQITSDDGALYSSFVPMVINNKISVMVNGHKDGLEKRMSAFTDNNMVYQLEFDGTGNMTKKGLYSGEQAETRLCPKVSYKVSDNEVILYNVRRSGKYRFAKVNF
jgi:hypothetical protein